jgi:DNA-binding PadR family transcriptional regulator
MPVENTLTGSEIVLLGLLSEGAKYAWQIEKDVEHRAIRYWTDLSQSTIYRQLTALEKTGMIESSRGVVDGRARKTYALTINGNRALCENLQRLLTTPEHMKYGVDLATYNVSLLNRKEALAALCTYREKLQEDIRCYEETEEYMRSEGCPAYRLAVVRRPRYLLQGDINWVNDFMEELENQ